MKKRPSPEGKLFIISAPSGCGKTTLCRKLLGDKLKLDHSVSFTTRPPRRGERHGKDYFFVSPEEFIAAIDSGDFLEYEENFGYLYGTPRGPLDEALAKGRNILLSIDVKGAMNVRRLYPKRSVLIFIMPPSTETLKKRLESRKADTTHSISSRLKLVRKEISYKDKYDYVVVNDNLTSAYRKLKGIVMAEGERHVGHTRG